MGGLVPAWVNAANEEAVAAFLEGRIGWGDISELIGSSLSVAECVKPLSVGDVVEADRRARQWAKKRIVEIGNTK